MLGSWNELKKRKEKKNRLPVLHERVLIYVQVDIVFCKIKLYTGNFIDNKRDIFNIGLWFILRYLS